VLSSTNLIENLFSRVREIARRVKRWQGGSMILRWLPACSKPRVTSAKSPDTARCRGSLPCFMRVMLQSIVCEQLIIEDRQPK